MECRKCNAQMTTDDITAEVAAHDDNMIDVIVTCPECGSRINDFLSVTEMQLIDDI